MKRQHRRMSLVASLLVGLALVLGASVPAGAQLSTSRWPMLQHDLQHTGQADLLGPAFWPNTTGAPESTYVKSLTFYPDVLKWMDDNLEWTRQVGQAFYQDSKKRPGAGFFEECVGQALRGLAGDTTIQQILRQEITRSTCQSESPASVSWPVVPCCGP